LPAESGPQLKLNGTVVKVKDGVCREWLSPLFFTSPTQVNYLVPSDVAIGTASISIFNEAGAIAINTVQVNSVAPGVFSANASGQGIAAASILRVKPDGTREYERAVQFSIEQAKYVAVPIDLTIEGDQVYLLLFGTGFRYRTALSNVTATIGGAPVDVLYAGAQGAFFGLDQVNLRLQKSLTGRGEIDLVLKVDGITANTVKVSFK
jgi:uncharacterized protein (TIGR03437 family)